MAFNFSPPDSVQASILNAPTISANASHVGIVAGGTEELIALFMMESEKRWLKIAGLGLQSFILVGPVLAYALTRNLIMDIPTEQVVNNLIMGHYLGIVAGGLIRIGGKLLHF